MIRRLVLLIALIVAAPAAWAWDDRLLERPLIADGRRIPYAEFALYLMPAATLGLTYEDGGLGGDIQWLGERRPLPGAPLVMPSTPGLYRLLVHSDDGRETVRLNLFVLVPAAAVDAQHRLRGYRIGAYPAEPLRGQGIYLPPTGFVEVTAANAEVRVSPNFTLGQFVSKQDQGYPRFVVLRPGLLLKLENILATLNRSGRPTKGLVIMSGYRTPFYNRSIGNVAYSRHVWGGAADIYIDENPRDGRMDDLNGDGRSDRADARWLADFVNRMSREGAFGPRVGGLGVYGSTAAHGPFIHVDVRGTPARW